MTEKEKLVAYSLDIDEKTKEVLQKMADEDHRTLAGQIRMILENYVEESGPKKRVRSE